MPPGPDLPPDRSRQRLLAARDFYGPLSAHGDAARRVGWESGAAHAQRLAALCEALAPLADLDALVDVGCGEGALLTVLRAAGFTGHYHGEDLRPDAIQRAEADIHASFEACDSFGAGRRAATAITCSGTLNTASGPGVDHDGEVEAALAALWARTGETLVCDLAIADRHPPGVGIARADLPRIWAFARALAPVVVVREDVTPGEALMVLSRTRARAYARRMSAPLLRGEALLAAGEAAAALALTGAASSAAALSLRGRALAALGQGREALATLKEAEARFADAGAMAERDQARLAQAPVLWVLGDRRGAEALLDELAKTRDEARAHLFELVLARRDVARARALMQAVVDPWIRRELAARLPPDGA